MNIVKREDVPVGESPVIHLQLERAAATGQLTPAEVQVYRSKFASAEAGCEYLAALVNQVPQLPSPSC